MRIDKSQVKMNGLINLSQQVLIGKKSLVYSRSSRVFCHAASLEEEFSAIQSKSFSKDEECDAEALLEETVERVPTSEEVCFHPFLRILKTSVFFFSIHFLSNCCAK